VVLQTLKRNDIRLVPYVPDRVLTTLIKNIHADPFFTTFPPRGGRSGRHRLRCVDGRHARRRADADLRLRHAGKCAGFAGDALSDSMIMFVSERGRSANSIWAVASVPHHAAGARLAGDGASHRDPVDEFEFIVDRSIKQAITTQAPVALILSPLLTGGKVFDK